MSALPDLVRVAVQRAFDEFARTMDRYILEDDIPCESVTAELHHQGLVDFADLWEFHVEGRDDE